jgi:hypothetical protein
MDYSLIALGLAALQVLTLLVWAYAPDTLADTYREVTGWCARLFPPVEATPKPRARRTSKPGRTRAK